MEILTSVKRLYISFKSLVNDFVYSFGHAALLLLVEVLNHTVPVRERGRIRVIIASSWCLYRLFLSYICCYFLHECSFDWLGLFSNILNVSYIQRIYSCDIFPHPDPKICPHT